MQNQFDCLKQSEDNKNKWTMVILLVKIINLYLFIYFLSGGRALLTDPGLSSFLTEYNWRS